ncbi:uncharacterized protein LOC132178109 [Corylus avellana]|uniref:uncharacterized protein LOC132178109 n=1 Tax=Corylus avellana TaxID=13451 RepID=UPI00286B9097|nr:uncharacterized protein LOC132178109 [Corylus avellana]
MCRHFVVACVFRSVTDNFEWAFAGVYGPNDAGIRSTFWDELGGVMNVWDRPWCVGGDFNVVRNPGERLRATRQTQAMTAFADFIFEHGLSDLPMVGGLTWSNRRARSRLDRFLISEEWEERYLDVCQKRFPRVLSDHFPVILECGIGRRGHIPFSYVLARKLKALKGDLKKWNVEVFGDIGKSKELEEVLGGLDSIAESRDLTEEETIRQKSRALWLKEGDRNTKFFHRLANSHKRNSTVAAMMVGGSRTEDPAAIQDHIVHFYKALYFEQCQGRPTSFLDPSMEHLNSIEEGERLWMEKGFEEEEV